MTLQNNYYSIAMTDLLFLQHSLDTEFYNQITIQCQQVVEKLLKSVLEIVSPQAQKLFGSHNLRSIATEIANNGVSLNVSIKDFAVLKDYYFESRYPGADFLIATRTDCEQALITVYDTVDAVNAFRMSKGLSTETFQRIPLTQLNNNNNKCTT